MAEYLSRAMAFAQDAAKLSLRFSEGIVENAIEFGLDTPGGFYDNVEYKLGQVRKELESSSDKEKVTGLKRLLAAVAKGNDVSEYFAEVVKNVASPNLEVRRLVYIYLLRYAEKEQDLALLSINTFQRDLTDSNQVIRALALRVMSSIRVPVISPIVMLAIKKCAGDQSPHVRKTAALAIPKLYHLDSSLGEELIGVVERMLNENSPLAVGSVIMAFQAICPARYDLIHPHYHRWCQMIGDLDEWGQVALVKMFTAYARTQFLNPAKVENQRAGNKKPNELEEFYSESHVSSGSKNNTQLDPDHAALLKALHPLLQSHNRAVVMAVVSAYCHIAPASQLDVVSKPLVRLMKGSRESSYVVLTNIEQIARQRSEIFEAYMRSFFVAGSDASFVRAKKLRILGLIVSRNNVNALIPELANYVKSPNVDLASGAVDTILACAHRIPEVAMDCFRSLLMLVADAGSADEVAAAAMRAVRCLLLDSTIRDSQMRRGSEVSLYDILCYLARALNTLKDDTARAHLFGLFADFTRSKFGALHAPDVLRSAAQGFKDEGEESKKQILELSTQLTMSLALPDNADKGDIRQKVATLHSFVFMLARYDVSYSVRDHARILRSLCPLPGYDDDHAEETPAILNAAHELLGAEATLASLTLDRDSAAHGFTIGSLALSLDRKVAGYRNLPDWSETKPVSVRSPPSMPHTAVVAPHHRAITIAGVSGAAARRSATYIDRNPGSSAAADEDDLDAFLNDDSGHSYERTYTVFRQSEVSSEDSSAYSSEEDSEDADSSCEELESPESTSDEGESEDELPHAEERGQLREGGDRSVADPGLADRGEQVSPVPSVDGESQTVPLMEGTSEYWQ